MVQKDPSSHACTAKHGTRFNHMQPLCMRSYYRIIKDFGIRNAVVGDVRGATRVKADAAK
eukprot:353069-Chlamydomonas_euryale.AAC.30